MDEPMDITRQNDGHIYFRLGPVERWVVAAGAVLLISTLGLIFSSYSNQQAKQGDTLSDVKTQMAVSNQQLIAIREQLADVPLLTSDVAQMKVQLARNASDIHDLQQVKGLHR